MKNNRKKKMISAAVALAMTASLAPLSAAAELAPNPIISRNCPAYTGDTPTLITGANDEFYYSSWNASAPDYLAYDLSGVPEENRQVIDAVWYNYSAYDVIGQYVNRNMEPSDYTIEINAAPGGEYPVDGWEIVETVSGSTLSSRQHIVSFAGYNWIRMRVTGADEKEGGSIQLNLDIHDVSGGVTDNWIFFGDSITAGGMTNWLGTGFATYIHQIDSKYFPVQECGGIGGIRSSDGKENIDRWLSTCPAVYVSLAYGTNDAWGNGGGVQNYYENTVYMIEAILAAGKTPILPKIPYSTNPDVGTYVPDYNEMVERIYEEYPQVIQGPDFYSYFEAHPEQLADGVHPDTDGYDAMRRMWAELMYERVYTAEAGETKPTEGTPTESVQGDVNGDGSFTLTDVVNMQKYILGTEKLAKPENGEFLKDGELDVVDLVLMKRAYLEQK